MLVLEGAYRQLSLGNDLGERKKKSIKLGHETRSNRTLKPGQTF